MKGHIFLVNPSHPLPEGYEPPSLSPALPGSEILLESECASALTALLGRIDAWDKIIPVSGYRPHNEQQTLWDETMRDYGEIFTRKYVAVPGCSEHETGLSVDLNEVSDDFKYTEAYRWLSENAEDYGFVQRYPEDKQEITGIITEPWHYRYVGQAAAKAMNAKSLCLEEYAAGLMDGSLEMPRSE